MQQPISRTKQQQHHTNHNFQNPVFRFIPIKSPETKKKIPLRG